MSSPGASPRVRPTAVEAAIVPPEDVLLRAFNDLRDELVSTLMFVLGNRDDAQDAAQDAFLKCWRNRSGLSAVQNLRAWIFRVALNVAKDLQRSAWRRRARPMLEESAMDVDGSDNPSAALEHREEIGRLRQAITTLRADEQEVFLLRQNGGLTYEQIAEIRNAPVGTVKTQMRTALQKLRKVLN
jgi:RNA polymerase sigma-70 factor (ECF subfamily)